MNQLTVTSPEEYAEKAKVAQAAEGVGFLHKLKKTGAVVRLRHMDMEASAVLGELPLSLVKAAVGTVDEVEAAQKKRPTPEEVEEGNKTLIFMRQTVVENCLEPLIRYEEGVGVFFVNATGQSVSRVDKDDFLEMFAVITGQEGNDGLLAFRNRKARRASAAQSRGKALQKRPARVAKGQPA
jgi:hypothetical protein